MTRSRPRRSSGTERSAPRSKSSFCTRASTVPDRLGHSPASTTPDRRVQLVDRAVRGDPGVELRHARAVAERGLARVAAARVDLRQPNRLVALARHASYITARDRRRGRPATADAIADALRRSFRGLTFLPTIHTRRERDPSSTMPSSRRTRSGSCEAGGRRSSASPRSTTTCSSTSTSSPTPEPRRRERAARRREARAAGRLPVLGVPEERRAPRRFYERHGLHARRADRRQRRTWSAEPDVAAYEMRRRGRRALAASASLATARTWRPRIERAMTSRWISLVPS